MEDLRYEERVSYPLTRGSERGRLELKIVRPARFAPSHHATARPAALLLSEFAARPGAGSADFREFLVRRGQEQQSAQQKDSRGAPQDGKARKRANTGNT